ncbi:MAG: short-chain dehydrogenase [Sulfobacillus acidophilus]|uniref:Short-chain dehydrogenase n=1 Tax=Sulfobacillus acidophilus TaxID=53633 RepID=A0A2T2WK84_9FIRM|nr:MAG: short-chain dehydrogenase [Sulfobacillus acidophilus]
MSSVSSHLHDGVGLWTLNNPPVNAISLDVLEQLEALLDQAEADLDVRALVITGHGSAFAAGADVSGFMRMGGDLPRFMQKGAQLFKRFVASRLPLVAAVNGIAYGGGLELAMAADIRLASQTARFGQPEVNLGIIPGWGGTVRLPKLVGWARARRLFLTGWPIDAQEAHRIGLVDDVVETRLLVDSALNLADRLASLAPLALAELKGLLAEGEAAGLERERQAIERLMVTQDAAEGVRAFLEKRRPRFSGR